VAITSRDIAREAGVSQSTVSRALNGDRRVAPTTRERVLAVARRHAYTPNAAARTLITSRTQTVGVVVSDITNPFYPQLVDVLHDELALAGYRLVLFNDRRGQASGQIAPQLQGSAVDGVILASATVGSGLAMHCLASGVPLVLLNRDVPDIDVDRVTSDNVAGGRIAAQALCELGHQVIATVGGPHTTSTGRDRLRGFAEELARRGHALDERLVRIVPYSHDSGYRCGLELLDLAPRPTAIFCANDVLAFGALDAAARNGVRVPADCSILGYDDIEMAAWEVFDLTTIRQPLARMAQAAARMLVERIELTGSLAGRHRVFEPELIVRGTAAAAPQRPGANQASAS
jgi:LacI family transcriptional regulator